MYDDVVQLREKLGYKKFTKLQEKVFTNNQIYENQRCWICGETSSGKTLIPYLLYARYRLYEKKEARMLYIVPYRSLALQKYNEMNLIMKQLFPTKLNIAISTAEYRESDEEIQNGNVDIAIMIYEKVYIFAGNGEFLKYFDYIVLDEFGIITNEDRGPKVDLLMLWITRLFSHVIVLSTPYIDWTEYIKTYNFLFIKEAQRPVRLETEPIIRIKSWIPTVEKIEKMQAELAVDNNQLLHSCKLIFENNHRVVINVKNTEDVLTLAKLLVETKAIFELIPEDMKIKSDNESYEEIQKELDGKLTPEIYTLFKCGIAILHEAVPDTVQKFVVRELTKDVDPLFYIIICSELHMCWNKSEIYTLVTVNRNRNSIIADICKKHLEKQKKVIVFLNNRTEIHNIARDLYRALSGTPYFVEDNSNSQNYKELLVQKIGMHDGGDTLYGLLDEEDCKAILSGIGVHSSALPQEFREYIERMLYDRDSKMRIVVTTETLAFGINSNADVVIIADMMNNGVYMTLNEYQNCAGRAGRLQKGESPDKQKGYIYPVLNGKRIDDWFKLSMQKAQKVENSLAHLDADHSTIYMLSIFRENKYMTYEEIKKEISLMPVSFKEVQKQLDYILDMLKERNMVKYYRDEFLSDEPLYAISSFGERMRSYPVSINTFDRITNMLNSVKDYKVFPLLDLIFFLCETEPMEKLIENVFTGINKYKFDKKLILDLSKKETQLLGKGLLKEGMISNKLYVYLIENTENEEMVLKIKATLALICWASGAKARFIYRTFYVPYGLIKQMGEQMSYLLEVSTAVAYGNVDFLPYCSQLLRYSISLFWGVPANVLDEFEIQDISVGKRQYLSSLKVLLRINDNQNINLEEKKQIKNILKEVEKYSTKDEKEKIMEKVQKLLS